MAAWDRSAPLRIGPAHSGPIQTVATARLDDGRTLIISGGDNWSLILWPLRSNGQIVDEPTPEPQVRALSVVDDEAADDKLNRGVLAAHLEGLLVQLITKQRAGTAVVHVDGRQGKIRIARSIFVTLGDYAWGYRGCRGG